MLFLRVILLCAIVAYAVTNEGFKNYPTKVKAFENDTVLLPCYADDLGLESRIRWWKESDQLLADNEDSSVQTPKRMKMWNNRSLEISNIGKDDSGKYVCQVSRPAPWGHVTQVHEVEVMYPATVHPVPESGILEINLGEEVDMSCIAKGSPLPVISWIAKDEEIPLLDNRARLTFHADNRNFTGRYTCMATNGVGEPAKAHINLQIRYKPEIEVTKTWIHASPGIRAQLDCRVTAWPEAKVEWFFKDDKIMYSPRIVKHIAGNKYSLIIRSIRHFDYGYYVCRAVNSLGITEAIIELSGVANPAVFKEVHSVSPTSYHFIWEVDSYCSIIEYQFWFREFVTGHQGEWHKLYIPIGTDSVGPLHAHAFNLTGLRRASHYEAIVLSRNRFGWSRPSKVLRFSTLGAPATNDESYKYSTMSPKKITPVVHLASMSQQTPYDETNGGSRKKGNFFLTVLPILCVTVAYVHGSATGI